MQTSGGRERRRRSPLGCPLTPPMMKMSPVAGVRTEAREKEGGRGRPTDL